MVEASSRGGEGHRCGSGPFGACTIGLFFLSGILEISSLRLYRADIYIYNILDTIDSSHVLLFNHLIVKDSGLSSEKI